MSIAIAIAIAQKLTHARRVYNWNLNFLDQAFMQTTRPRARLHAGAAQALDTVRTHVNQHKGGLRTTTLPRLFLNH
jgi:hypothetical protein